MSASTQRGLEKFRKKLLKKNEGSISGTVEREKGCRIKRTGSSMTHEREPQEGTYKQVDGQEKMV